VNDFLTEYFPDILDYNFTATVEKEFDRIAEGEEDWTKPIDKFYKVFHPVVESAVNAQTGHKVGERILGVDPKTGRQVSVKIGRFGPMVQVGIQDEEEKPQFAGLQKTQSIATITLEEALKLFELPRSIGEFEGKDVTVGAGRFGPYIKHDGKFISLPKGHDPYSVDLDSVIPLIKDKRQKDAEKVIKTFAEDADLQILNGRFGPYIVYKKTNYKIPKNTAPESLDFGAVMEIVKTNEDNKPAAKAKKSKARKK
jgi:DNA topoisomerase-1